MLRTSGQVVLITGASEGIGAACAEVFRRRGALLALTARSADRLAKIGGNDALIIAGDLTSAETQIGIVNATLERYGRIDVLVNNAGKGLYGSTASASLSSIRDVFELNLFAPLALLQLVVPIMQKQARGTIVNIASIGGKVTLPWLNAYCGSKFALAAMTDGLRMELAGTGVHALTVYPGYVLTRFQENATGTPPQSIKTRRKFAITPQQCAEDIASAVERQARNVMSPVSGWAFLWAHRLFPGLVERQLTRMNRNVG